MAFNVSAHIPNIGSSPECIRIEGWRGAAWMIVWFVVLYSIESMCQMLIGHGDGADPRASSWDEDEWVLQNARVEARLRQVQERLYGERVALQRSVGEQRRALRLYMDEQRTVLRRFMEQKWIELQERIDEARRALDEREDEEDEEDEEKAAFLELVAKVGGETETETEEENGIFLELA